MTIFDDDVTSRFLAAREQYTATDIALATQVATLASEGATGIDLGCGDGRYAQLLHRLGIRSVVGIDISPPMIRRARYPLREGNGVAVLADVQCLPIVSASIDIALANFLFHYLRSSRTAAREIARVLKPGGWLVAVLSANDVPENLATLYNTPFPLILGDAGIEVTAYLKSVAEFHDDLAASGLAIERSTTLPNPAAAVGTFPFADRVALRTVLVVARRPLVRHE